MANSHHCPVRVRDEMAYVAVDAKQVDSRRDLASSYSLTDCRRNEKPNVHIFTV
jgi:hypothetical protein